MPNELIRKIFDNITVSRYLNSNGSSTIKITRHQHYNDSKLDTNFEMAYFSLKEHELVELARQFNELVKS